MYSNTNCPLGADTPDAPWNQDDKSSVKVRVLISVTLSKSVEVEVSDYNAENSIDEDGNPTTDYDFSETDLKTAVTEQTTLPSNAFSKLHKAVYSSKDKQSIRAVEDLKGWCVDDYEVMLD